ncbi:MAG: crossover junction endodeoxyribonuclease RuvC [Parcubacteria group bacterium]|nr:crossover junction endodeoxyribonuclease RuvC [Parcubacteria group bacterium]
MIILGIDPGIARLGYGIILKNNSRISCLDYGCLETAKTLAQSERLMILHDSLSKIIQKQNPNFLAIERLFFAKNAKTALNIAEIRGVILLLAQKMNLKIKEVTPIQVKQSLTSYGRADKKQVSLMVQKLLNLKKIPKPDDAADALAIAIAAWA